MSSRRSKRPRSRRITKRAHRSRCKPVSRNKICGPRTSCRYPKTYSRAELVRLAKRDPDVVDEAGDKGVNNLSTPQLCSYLGLTTQDSVKFNRIIDGRKCGPTPESTNSRVWTKDQLLSYIRKNQIIPITKASQMHREELCVAVADWSHKQRAKTTTYRLPEADIDLYPILEYRGGASYVYPFIYSLLTRYKDLCFFMRPTGNKAYVGASYDCETTTLKIHSELTTQMKNSTCRFFATLVALQEEPYHKGVSHGAGRHANFLLYDRKLNQVWHYEPLRGGKYHDCDTETMFRGLEQKFRKEVNPKLTFISAPSYCPKLNLSRLIFKHKHKGFNPVESKKALGGLCVVMNLWILDNKLAHPDLSLAKVNEQAIKALHEHEYGMLNHILNWMAQYLRLREILESDADEAGQDFNVYMNALIRDEQKRRFKKFRKGR